MPNNIIQSFVKKSGKSIDVVEKKWKEAEKIVKKEYPDKTEDKDFFPIVVGILKKMLGIEEESQATITTGDVPRHYTPIGTVFKKMDKINIKKKKKKMQEDNNLLGELECIYENNNL